MEDPVEDFFSFHEPIERALIFDRPPPGEQLNEKEERMSHRHFCDFAGHYWECEGTATRLFAPEPSICMCLNHGVPMSVGQHCECSVELLSCPEHRADQMRAMGYEPGQVPAQPPAADAEESSMFKDADGNPIVGFCLWCNRDFYSMEEVEAHNADGMANCTVFQELKDEHCMPPVMQAMFEQADLKDTGDK
jgi:hypothetical protein